MPKWGILNWHIIVSRFIFIFLIFRVRWHKSQIMGYSSQRLYFYLQRPQWDRYLPQIQPRRPMGGLWWRRRCSQGQYIRTLKMQLLSRLQRMLFSFNPIPTRQRYFLLLWYYITWQSLFGGAGLNCLRDLIQRNLLKIRFNFDFCKYLLWFWCLGN